MVVKEYIKMMLTFTSLEIHNLFIFSCFVFFFQLTHMTMAGELKHGKRVEELKFTENVKKKTSNFVRKYMAKHDPSKAEYQRSPPPAPKD